MNDLVSIAKSSVFYRVAVRSFFDSDADGIGDLRGLIAKLPYFLYLGTDSVILTDVIESDHDGVTDFCRVDPAVGTNEDLEELIAAMHSENLKVYLSFSPIFTSTAHSWFEKSAKSPDLNHFREYYVWKSGKDAKGKTPPDDRKTRSKESAWTFQKGYWYFSESGKGRPSLNYDNLRVRKEMLEVLRFWREKGVDGFVFENARLLPKSSATFGAMPLYTNYDDTFSVGAPLYRLLREIAERFACDFPVLLDSDGIDPSLFPFILDGECRVADQILFDQPIDEIENKSFSFKKFLKKYLAMQSDDRIKKIGLVFGNGSHDRLLSRVAREKDGAEATKMLCALLLTAPSVPVIYQGEEIGMTDLPKKAVDRSTIPCPNARAPFQWDNKSNAGFTLALYPFLPVNENYHSVNCAVQSAKDDSPLCFYRKIIDFRRNSSALSVGNFADYSSGDVVAFTRETNEEALLVVVNTLARNLNYAVPAVLANRRAECLISSCALVGKTLHESIGLRPYEVRIYRFSRS